MKLDFPAKIQIFLKDLYFKSNILLKNPECIINLAKNMDIQNVCKYIWDNKSPSFY